MISDPVILIISDNFGSPKSELLQEEKVSLSSIKFLVYFYFC